MINQLVLKGDAVTLYAAYNNCNFGKITQNIHYPPDPAIADGSLLQNGFWKFIGRVGTGNIYYMVQSNFANLQNLITKEGYKFMQQVKIADLEAL
jgi:hypothetical protein